jgi:hypothetical protein
VTEFFRYQKKGLRETTKVFSQNSEYLGRNLNTGRPEHEAESSARSCGWDTSSIYVHDREQCTVVLFLNGPVTVCSIFKEIYNFVSTLQHLEQVPLTLHKEDEAGFSFLHFKFPL